MRSIFASVGQPKHKSKRTINDIQRSLGLPELPEQETPRTVVSLLATKRSAPKKMAVSIDDIEAKANARVKRLRKAALDEAEEEFISNDSSDQMIDETLKLRCITAFTSVLNGDSQKAQRICEAVLQSDGKAQTKRERLFEILSGLRINPQIRDSLLKDTLSIEELTKVISQMSTLLEFLIQSNRCQGRRWHRKKFKRIAREPRISKQNL